MQGAQPHRARAFRIESGLLDVLCVAMLVVGLGFIIA